LDGIAGMERPGVGLAEALGHLRPVELDEQQLAAVRNGAAPRTVSTGARGGEILRRLDSEGTLCALAEAGPAGMMKLKRVFVNDDRR